MQEPPLPDAWMLMVPVTVTVLCAVDVAVDGVPDAEAIAAVDVVVVAEDVARPFDELDDDPHPARASRTRMADAATRGSVMAIPPYAAQPSALGPEIAFGLAERLDSLWVL